jgi:hypothetical protein
MAALRLLAIFKTLFSRMAKTRFAMIARALGLVPAKRLYQNRNVIPTWLG